MIDTAGTYRGVPVECGLGVTSTQKEQIAVVFELLDPPGERLTWYGYFTDASIETTYKALRAIGWQGCDITEFAAGALPEGVDKQVDLVVEMEEGNDGVYRPRIRWVNGGGGVAIKTPLNAAQTATLAARLKAKFLGFDQRSGEIGRAHV